MKMAFMPLWLAFLFVQACDAWTSPPTPVDTRRVFTMLVDNNDDKGKQRIISPNDISSLFGGGSKSTKNEKAPDYEDEDEDFDYGDTVVSSPSPEESTVEEPKMIQKRDGKTEDSETMRELFALEELMKRPPEIVQEIVEEDVPMTSKEELVVGADDSVMESELDEYGMGYMNLNRKLDKAARKSVLDTISMAESKSESQIAQLVLPRLVTYDPTETYRGDPMKYGAYRRWKLAETEDGKPRLDSQGKPLKTKGTKSGIKPKPNGYRPGDYKVDGQGNTANGNGRMLGGSSGLKKKGKNSNKGEDTDSAMEKFIKKFGTGAGNSGGRDGSTGGTGFSEPPSNKNPIQPKKGPTKKNKKRVITPDDINSLFTERQKEESADDDDEDDDEEDTDDEDSEDNELQNIVGMGVVSSTSSSSSAVKGFNPMLGPDDEVPQWIVDANKEAERKKKLKSKKKKNLTDDWRFWAACLVTAGFASAFWNIYQQTGGFGSGPSGPERQELII